MTVKEFPAIGERYFEERLENGLLVRIIEKPGFAKKYAFAAVNYGSIDRCFIKDGIRNQTPAGVAHYLEHKMFDLPEGNAMEAFAEFGGSNNAFTSYNMTAYYVECTEHFAENLSILLRMVTTPYFTAESVEKERSIIAQEIKMYDDSADSAVQENLLRVLYKSHPIRTPIAGSVESIADITPETLYACHKAFYDASNLMLCVMGDVDARDVIEQARRETPASTGHIAGRDYGEPEELSRPFEKIEAEMEVSMPTFSIGFRAKPLVCGFEALKEELVASLAAEILCGESTELYKKLYEDGTIDGDFSIDFEYMPGMAMLEASGDSEQPETIRQALLKQAEILSEEGVDTALFERLKKSMLGRRLRELDAFEGTCFRMCAYAFYEIEYLDYTRAFEQIKPEDIVRFIREVVREERCAMSVVYPKGGKKECI